MKTLKPLIIAAMFLSGAILYGQPGQVPYLNTGSVEKSSRIENLVYKFLSLAERTERRGYMEPVIYSSYTFKQAEVVYEAQPELESWMSSPFDCGVYETEMSLEPWMAVPFESSQAEPGLIVESWMTVPFQNTVMETELLIEKWMTFPFEADEYIKIESWMTAAF